MSGYNGFKNWATWNFALWHMDALIEEAQDYADDVDNGYDVKERVLRYWDMVKDGHAELQDVTWLNDVVDSYEDEIDWNEIVELVWDNVLSYKEQNQ
jgi:hypothetical protein